MAFHALAALDDRDGVTLLVTGDEELGSPSSRALIEDEARAAQAALVLEASADGGALKTERKGVSLYDVRVLGRAAHAGLEPEHGVNATVELAHQVLAVAALGRHVVGTTVTPTASGSRHDHEHGARRRVVRGRRPGADRRRAGARRRRDALAARGAARCRAGGHRRPEPPRARGRVLGGAVRPGRRARRAPRAAAAHARRPSAARRTATSPRASARPRSTASAPSGEGRTPTTSTCSSRSSPAARPCSVALVADLLAQPTNRLADDWCGATMTSRESCTSMGAVTNLNRVAPVDTDLDHGAVVAADAAALAAGVSVREVTDLAELADVVALYATIWGRSENPPVTLELLRAFAKAGNYVGGAFDGRPAGRRVRRLLPRARRGRAAQPHRRRRAGPERAARRVRAQAAPAGVGDAARRVRDRLDLRPAGQPQRLLQPGEAGGRPGRVPAELLRPDARHHQRRRRLRPAAGALAAARPRGRSPRASACPRRPSIADELAAGAVVALGMGADGAPEPGDLDGADRAGRRTP